METRRTGKIARLPKDARNIVSQMLEDGATYDAIIQKLQELGYPGFNAMNLHRWKNGGFRDWQLQQLTPIRHQNLTLLKDPHPDGSGLSALRLATEHFYRVLMDFDHDLLRQDLNKNPENYFRIIRSFNGLIQNRFALEQRISDKAFEEAWREQMAEQDKKQQPKPRPRPKKEALAQPQELDQAKTDQPKEPPELDAEPPDQAAA